MSPISAPPSASFRPRRSDALRTDQSAPVPDPDRPLFGGCQGRDTIYVSGVLALGEGGTVLHVGDAAAQTRHVLDVIRITVEAAGGTMADIAMNHIFLKDLGDYAAFNAVYAEYFPGDKPARYCIRCDLVKPDCLVEIASVAHLG